MTPEKNTNIFISDIEQLSNLEIKKKYLNRCEWTETIIIALSQIQEEWQGIRIIKLALEVDLILGAILVGALQESFQQKAIKLMTNLNLNETVLIELLTKTQSKYAIVPLQEILNNLINCSQTDFYRGYKISNILTAISVISLEDFSAIIVQLLQDKDFYSLDIDLDLFNDYDWESLNFSSDDLMQIKKVSKHYIDNPDMGIRTLAFEYLVRLKDTWAITELQNDYHRKDYIYLKKWNIIDIFSNINDKSLIKYLIYGLFEDDRGCRSQAVEGLIRKDNIAEDLAIDILLHGLCQKIENECDRSILNTHIGEALNKISPDKSLKKIALMAQCDDAYVRSNVIKALVRFHHKQVLQIVIKALDDISDEVIVEALRSLYAYCQIQNKNIENILPVKTLIGFLNTNNTKIFKLTLELVTHRYNLEARAFSEIANRELIYPILLERLQDKNRAIKIEAIYNLGYFNNRQVENNLLQLIEDKDSQIQGYAANALGNLGEQKNIPLLVQKIKHPEPIVREGAANGLRLMSSALAKQPLIEALQDSNPQVQKSILEALGAIGGEELETYLIELIKNTDLIIVIDDAIRVLGIIGGEKTVELLAQMLQKFFSATTREEFVGIADPEIIIDTLERIGTPSAIETLLAVGSDSSYIGGFALNALTNIGGLYIIPRLWEKQLKSEDPIFFEAIANIQKSYQHYNPKYCESTPLNIYSDAIHRRRNNWEHFSKYYYSYLGKYYESY